MSTGTFDDPLSEDEWQILRLANQAVAISLKQDLKGATLGELLLLRDGLYEIMLSVSRLPDCYAVRVQYTATRLEFNRLQRACLIVPYP